MAVKPGTVPAIWAPGAVYTSGPFVGLSNKVPVAGAVANDGHRPGAADPTPAEYVNDQQNKITTWIFDWLSQGLATAAANTHIVETDANGRTEIIGLDITDAVDRTVATWSCANTFVPAFVLQTSGNGLQVENTGLGVGCFSADMSGGSALGFTCLDGATDGATAFSIFLQGSGGLGSMTCTGGSASGLSLNLTTSASDTLVLTNGGGGAPVRVSPQVPPGVLVPGQMWADALNNDFEGTRPSGVRTAFWSSEFGYNYSYASSSVVQAAGGSYVSFNYGFALNKRYIIRYSFSYGRTVGSTQDPIDFANVGGLTFPPGYAEVIDVGDDVPIAGRVSGEWEFVSPLTGVLLVDLFIGVTAGINVCEIQSGWISVTGAFD